MNNEFNEESSFAAYINKLSPKITAEIELTDFAQGGDGKAVAFGKVFNDSKKRFNDGDEIITSLVRNAETYKNDGYIITRNSIYKIREPKTDDTIKREIKLSAIKVLKEACNLAKEHNVAEIPIEVDILLKIFTEIETLTTKLTEYENNN
ncbi:MULTISPECIES: hypothetical protein [Xenorhabdus]|uniref:hypothetical protein n=1 Tax=Xenorhabdus TaxID=626 RepID=UPI00064A17EF|nr:MULTISPECIES: hypothetical protein [Xenorhabdus]KLU15368.1 hypothetical protein AAY47_10965 [Xenorhabdus griffiniae]KOP32163.1 hypothetical protein AFK69_16895 [Xenorhabdus sp. GDc328]